MRDNVGSRFMKRPLTLLPHNVCLHYVASNGVLYIFTFDELYQYRLPVVRLHITPIWPWKEESSLGWCFDKYWEVDSATGVSPPSVKSRNKQVSLNQSDVQSRWSVELVLGWDDWWLISSVTRSSGVFRLNLILRSLFVGLSGTS